MKKHQSQPFLSVFFRPARSLVHSSTTSDTLAIVVGRIGPPIGLELTGSPNLVVDSDIGEFVLHGGKSVESNNLINGICEIWIDIPYQQIP